MREACIRTPLSGNYAVRPRPCESQLVIQGGCYRTKGPVFTIFPVGPVFHAPKAGTRTVTALNAYRGDKLRAVSSLKFTS